MKQRIIISLLVVAGLGLLSYMFWSLNKSTTLPSTNHAGHNNTSGDTATSSPYEIIITSAYDPLQGLKANQKQTISFIITKNKNDIVRDFELTHEKIIHVIIARGDLTLFEHIHPEFDETIGQFTFDMTFPKDGFYRMFADFTPRGGANATPSYDLMIGGLGAGIYAPLQKTTNPIQSVDGLLVRYQMPNSIKAGKEFTYSLQVTDDDAPAPLDPYLGALGHSVILRENSLAYIHTHAHDMHNLAFTATLPERGKYKIFTQFQYKEKVHTSTYVVEAR